MLNEVIQAISLIDTYEALKDHREADAVHLDELRSMLNQYGLFHKIKDKIGESEAKATLWWPCVKLEESLWDSIRRFLTTYGYDPEWIYWKKGKAGLRGFDYIDGIPCLFDEILITFDGKERMKNPIPVRKDGKCGLVWPDGTATPVTPFKYDLLFREPHSDYVKYIAMMNDKYGIVDITGKEVIPCILDDIFARQDTDSFLPILKDGKWGIFPDIIASYILPKFDELDIQSEDYLRARIGTTWGWVTAEGDLSDDKTEAAFGSWAEEDK